MMKNYHKIVIGYHGCDQSTHDKIVSSVEQFRSSENDYDWLGHGVYFWQDDPLRAEEFAKEQVKRGRYKSAAIVGAVIDLGNCLNLHTRLAAKKLELSYGLVKDAIELSGEPMPENKWNDKGGFPILRKLDCAVIETMHKNRKSEEEYDSVLGIFQEDEPVYVGAGFRKKTHIQICVRKTERILGVFIPNRQHLED